MVAFAQTEHRLSDAFDPDSYRMSLGEHLEELRTRLLWAMLGFGVALALCLLVGKDRLLLFFCRPLVEAQGAFDLNTQLQEQTPGSVFMVYLKVSMITAAALSAPWSLYQLWKFVAAGLYPHERRHLTRYVPLSVTLLVAGMAFVYYAVLPWSLKFFIAFTMSIPAPDLSPGDAPGGATLPAGPATFIQVLDADPTSPAEGQWWLNRVQRRVKLHFGGDTRTVQFGPPNLVGIQYTLPEYVDLALLMLISFGVSFQLPLAVLAWSASASSSSTPCGGPGSTSTSCWSSPPRSSRPALIPGRWWALAVPLCLLYELGVWLAATRLPGERSRAGA